MDEARVRPSRHATTVAFDWNGTLLADTDRAWQAARVALGRRGLRQPGRQEFFRRWRLPLERLFSDFGVGPTEVATAIDEWNEEVGAREANLAPGALEMLQALRAVGTRVGVVSAAAPHVIEQDLARLGLGRLLDFTVGGAEPKRVALSAIRGDDVGRVIYVGDTEYDMVEARAAGAWAVGYGGGYRPSRVLHGAGAHYVIDRLELLPDLVRQLDGRARRTDDAS